MSPAQKRRLIDAATEARHQAVAPFSKFAVGAALLTRDHQIVLGANVESASHGLTCCAERVALFKALTDGCRDFTALAVVSQHDAGATPCGACRQLLMEYAGDALILVADFNSPDDWREFTVKELLPHPFTLL